MLLSGRYPMFRLLLAFAAGILAGIGYPEPGTWMLVPLLTGAGLLSASALSTRFSGSFRQRWIPGTALVISFFAFGHLYTNARTEFLRADHYTRIAAPLSYACRLTGSPEEKSKSRRVEGRVVMVKTGDRWVETSGRLLLYLGKDSLSALPRYGDVLFFKRVPQPLRPPSNPGAFDYRRHMQFRQVDRSVYLPSGSWTFSMRGQEGIRGFAYGLRDRLLGHLKDHLGFGNEFAIASALILGDERSLTGELEEAYAGAGVIHLLAVSGLHVGIVFLALGILLGWMDRWPAARHLKYAVMLLFIWLYAMITGFSPSVSRAAAMLSFVIAGTWTGRDPQAGNSIIASAFFLLLADPFMLTHAGFQLSYLAVIGICFIHPHLFRQFETRHLLLHRTWELFSVSLTAQLMTFPLVLLYFSQFPNYFFISNLVVIPLATGAIYSGMLFVLLALLGNTLKLLVTMSLGALYLMNEIVRFIDKLPGAVSKVSITPAETVMLYLLLLAGVAFTIRHNPRYLLVSLSALVMLAGSRSFGAYQDSIRRQLIIYDVPGHSAIDFITGRQHVFHADTALTGDDRLADFHIRPCWVKLNLERPLRMNPDLMQTRHLVARDGFIWFHGLKIRIEERTINSQGRVPRDPIQVDILVLTGNRFQQAQPLTALYDAGTVIIDSSFDFYRGRYIKRELEALDVTCHSVRHDGAFVTAL